ncbi:MAG: hypothetical protein WC546_05590 [Candidatus Omnitrophota bacterium]
MTTSASSDWAVLIIAVAFFSLIIYAIIHGRLQAKKGQKELTKEK